MASLNSSSIVMYKDQIKAFTEKTKMPGNKIRKDLKTATYASLSDDDDDEDDDDDDDKHSKHSQHSKHSLFSRSKKSRISISNLSHLSPKSSMKISHRKADDNRSKSSKSFSVKTFYRNRRSRNRNPSHNPYHGLITTPISSTHSGNWRCDECNYFPNTAFDPHCYKCGAMKQIHLKIQNKARKRTVSMTGTTSSSPVLAPGSVPVHSSRISQNNIIVHSTDEDDEVTEDTASVHDSFSDSSTDDSSVSDDKAIIVEDYRSKTSQSNSCSRNAIAQMMDIDDNIDVDIHIDTDINVEHSDTETLTMKMLRWSNKRKRSYSLSTPKTKEWDAFQWYLAVKRFILAVLYLVITLEEAFVLKYVKKWMVLPLTLCVTYVLLIVYMGRFNVLKYNNCVRSVFLSIFYLINVLIIIAPPMNALIASSKVYDFRDILDRDMLCNNLMWITFGIAVFSMVFIDVVIVHDDDDDMNDKFRVETYKLAVVKDEEYVLNNQCLWYTVPRKDWDTIHKSKLKQNTHNDTTLKKQDTKSFFMRIDNNNTDMLEEDDESSSEDDGMDGSVAKIGNTNMKNRNHLNTDNGFDDDRHSTYSITNIINKSRESKIRRCCTKPFSCLQWTLTSVFFISMQLCVLFAMCDTTEIQKHDVSGPPPQE